MKCRIRIGEDDSYFIGKFFEESGGLKEITVDGKEEELVRIDESPNVIAISENEIVSIKVSTVGMPGQNKDNNINGESGGVNTEKGFSITVVGKILTKTSAADKIVMYSGVARTLGFLPTTHDGYKDIEKNIRDSVKFNDVLEGASFGLGLLDAMGTIQSVENGVSIENCNKLKNWALNYKVASQINENEDDIYSASSNKNKFEDYRNVRIEIVISDVQSLYYEIKDMYISDYTENFDIEKGTGTFTLVLNQKYTSNARDINITIADKESFTDKISEKFKLLKATLLATGATVKGGKINDN